MSRVYSNGPAKDFVANPFARYAAEATQISVASPFVTQIDGLVNAARRGCRVDLLVGLNIATSPQALYTVQKEPNVRVRYYTHRRFHAKIYLLGNVALVGSSNLTDGGLHANREATIIVDDSEDPDAFEELRAVFAELWEYAPVLTDDVLKRFAEEHKKHKPSAVDDLIGNAVGNAEPPNINVASQKRSSDRIFLESLRREVAEYRNAFTEISNILNENRLYREELEGIGNANQTNRFLSWVRLKRAPKDAWETAPIRSQGDRRDEIIRLAREWVVPENDNMHEEYLRFLKTVQGTFQSSNAIETSSKEELTLGLTSLHAFYEQLRFVKGGEAQLPVEFWAENKGDISRVKRTLKYLVHGGGDFVERLHDVLFGSQMKLRLFGRACALELFGTIKPGEYPPINGRIVKGLRYLGFDVR